MPDTGQRDAKRDALNRVSSRAEACQDEDELPNPPPEAGLSIVIPAYNALGTIDPLLAQLAALPEVESGLYEVIITDDASTDGTVAILRERYPHFAYIESSQNSGFGPNCNRGIAAAGKAYCALVNTDIELCGKPFALLLEELQAHPDYFALMPLVYNTVRQQVENLQRLKVTYSLPWNEDLPVHEEFSCQIAASFEAGRPLAELGPKLRGLSALSSMRIINSILCGACFVCRTAKLRELGGFDPRYAPCYWEDVDLGQRALNGGGPSLIGTMTSCLVIHRHSETINRVHGRSKLRFLRRNQLRFSLRHLRPECEPVGLIFGTGLNLASQLIDNLRTALRCAEKQVGYRLPLLLRMLREVAGGDPAICFAYLKAALGAHDV